MARAEEMIPPQLQRQELEKAAGHRLHERHTELRAANANARYQRQLQRSKKAQPLNGRLGKGKGRDV